MAAPDFSQFGTLADQAKPDAPDFAKFGTPVADPGKPDFSGQGTKLSLDQAGSFQPSSDSSSAGPLDNAWDFLKDTALSAVGLEGDKSQSTGGDFGRALAKGATVDVAQTVAPAMKFFTAGSPMLDRLREVAGDAVNTAVNRRGNTLSAEMSDTSKAANAKNFFGDEATWANLSKDGIANVPSKIAELVSQGKFFGSGWGDWRKVALSATESAPVSVLSMLPVIRAAGAAHELALAQALDAGATKEAAQKIATKAAKNTASYMGAASEGATGATQQWTQTYQQVLALPQDKIEKSPEYQKAKAAMPADWSEARKANEARKSVAEAAANTAGVVAGVSDALFAGLGDRYIGGAVSGEGGRVRSMAMGALEETPTETLQSGAEQFGTNLGIQKNADPSQQLMDQVGEQAVAGGLSGGLMGVGFGAAAHTNAEPAAAAPGEAVPAGEVLGTPGSTEAPGAPAEPPAPPPAGPSGPGDGGGIESMLADPKALFAAVTQRPAIFGTIEQAIAAMPEFKAAPPKQQADVAAALKEMEADPKAIFAIASQRPDLYQTIAQATAQTDKLARTQAAPAPAAPQTSGSPEQVEDSANPAGAAPPSSAATPEVAAQTDAAYAARAAQEARQRAQEEEQARAQNMRDNYQQELARADAANSGLRPEDQVPKTAMQLAAERAGLTPAAFPSAADQADARAAEAEQTQVMGKIAADHSDPSLQFLAKNGSPAAQAFAQDEMGRRAAEREVGPTQADEGWAEKLFAKQPLNRDETRRAMELGFGYPKDDGTWALTRKAREYRDVLRTRTAEGAAATAIDPAQALLRRNSDATDEALVSRLNARTGGAIRLAAPSEVPVSADARAGVKIASSFGKRVVFIHAPQRIAGLVLPEDANTIYVNVRSSHPALPIIGHELLHTLRRTNGAIYSALHARVLPMLQNVPEYRAWMKEALTAEGQELTDSELNDLSHEELIADFLGDHMVTPAFWAEVFRGQEKSWVEKLRSAVQLALDALRIRLSIGGKRGFGSEAYVKNVDGVRRAMAEAFNAWSREAEQKQETRRSTRVAENQARSPSGQREAGVMPGRGAALPRVPAMASRQRAQGLQFNAIGKGAYTVSKAGREIARADVAGEGSRNFINNVRVDPEFRRQGVATFLYDQIERERGKRLTPSPRYVTPDGKAFLKSRGVEVREQHTLASRERPSRGVNVEVAPNPENKPLTERFNALLEDQKKDVTYRVAQRVIPMVMGDMGVKLYSTEYTIGGYQGETNPSIILHVGKVPYHTLVEVGKVIGWAFSQQAIITYDERIKTGENITGFVKVTPSRALTYEENSALFKAINKAAPDAQGFTARDGSLVFGNYSSLKDVQFRLKIQSALRSILQSTDYDLTDSLHKFRSDWVEPVTLKGTRYGQTDFEGSATGRDSVRWQGRADSYRQEADAILRRFIDRGEPLKSREDRPGNADSQGQRSDGAGTGLGNDRGGPGRPDAGRSGSGRALPGGLDRAGQKSLPVHGEVVPNSFTLTGVHYSTQQLGRLDSAYYGRGMRDQAAQRVREAKDARLRHRVHFYFNTGKGIRAESGVGGVAHAAVINGMYDGGADPLRLRAKAIQALGANTPNAAIGNAFESAVLDAGFTGYFTREFGNQGAGVLLGPRSVEVVQHSGKDTPTIPGSPAKDIDTAAHEAATSKQNDTPPPSLAQIEAGNYKKGHIKIGGLDISIENPAGSKRRPEWPTLRSHYGYIRGTIGRDKDHVDVFVKPGTPADFVGPVYVVDQQVGGRFDEHKVMLGWTSMTAAKIGYEENYQRGWDGVRDITLFRTVDEFKQWLAEGDTKAPAAPQAVLYARERFATPDSAIEFIAKERGISYDDVMQAYGYANPRDYITLAKGLLEEKGQGDIPRLVLEKNRYGDWVSPDGRFEIVKDAQDYWARVDGEEVGWGRTYAQARGWLLRQFQNDLAAGRIKSDGEAKNVLNRYTPEQRGAVIAVWSRIAELPGAFRFSHTEATDPKTIARDLGVDRVLVNLENNDMGFGEGYIDMQFIDGSFTQVHYYTKEHEAYVDAANMVKGGFGAQAYALALTWAANNKYVLVPDPAGLSLINTYRRTEQMFSAALRLNTTKYMRPHPDQGLFGWIKNPATDAQETHNLALLALTTYENVMKADPDVRGKLIDTLSHLHYNFEEEAFENGKGQPVPRQRWDELAKTDASRAVGSGITTLQRAVLTQSILTEAANRSGEGLASLVQDVPARGLLDEEHPLRAILYARQRDPGSREVAGSRGRSGALSRAALGTARAATTAAKLVTTPLDLANRGIEAAIRLPAKLLVAPVTSRLYDRVVGIGQHLAQTNPIAQQIAHGLIADYGLPEPYLDARQDRDTRIQTVLRKSKALIDQIAGLSRAEARVAYLWMQEAPNSDTEAQLLAQLPEESRQVLAQMKAQIDTLGRDAVSLGLLSQESYDRNHQAYLHRTYQKYELENPGAVNKGQQAKSIRADAYRGRGLKDDVNPKRLPGVTQGAKYSRMELRSPATSGLGALERVVYLPAGQPIPASYAGWRNDGVWEARWMPKKDGDAIGMWRDLSPEERERLGEIDEVRYAFARTMLATTRDIETARFLDWVYKTYAKSEAEVEEAGGKIAEAVDSMVTLSTYADNDWVQVPTGYAKGTKIPKYGNLAGAFVPGHIWNDIRSTMNFRSNSGVWRLYDELLRGWKINKALALDTPIPTPGGWTTMGALRPGDTVFDERGKPCEVLQATEIQRDHECYRVEFSDGTSIVADAGHLWYTEFHGRPGIRETHEIAATLKERTRGDNNHRVPVACALNLPAADLPIHPYVLGLWLGDGHSSGARVTTGADDADEIMGHVTEAGYEIGAIRRDPRSNALDFGLRTPGVNGKTDGKRRHESLQAKLRALGLIGCKHIPAAYLRASEEQRRALLQGLMDTDGHSKKDGLCGFATSIPSLRDGMMELLRSLGYKPAARTYIPKCNGKPGKPSAKIHFKAYADEPVFKLARKVQRLKTRPQNKQRSSTRQIVSVKSVHSVPVRCILVSSASHLFLAGEGMVPTHNTALSPVVHTNNIMSNFILADMADIRHEHIRVALRTIIDAQRGDEAARALMERFYASGAEGGSQSMIELRTEIIEPMLADLANEQDEMLKRLSLLQALSLAIRGHLRQALAAASVKKGAQIAAAPFKTMIEAYREEDSVFRLAKFMKETAAGKADREAGKEARVAILDYNINAPWIQALRRGPLPFVSFSYRAIPLLIQAAAKRPEKMMKYFAAGYALNALAYAMLGAAGDEDKERKLMPDEKSGRALGVFYRMLRMPWNADDGSPVFFDVRRWIPGGDIVDLTGSKSAIPLPSWLSVGGPISLFIELAANENLFTGKPIVKQSDTPLEQTTKIMDHLFKFLAPNMPIPNPIGYAADAALMDNGLFQTYSWKSIQAAGTGQTDAFGRERNLAQAIAAAGGVKVGAQPADVAMKNLRGERDSQLREISETESALRREAQKGGLTTDQLRARIERQDAKARDIRQRYNERMGLERIN